MSKPPYVLAILLALPAQALAAEAKNWPAPIMALQTEGVEVVGTFKAPGGLTGYAGRVGQQPLAIYLTSDGKYAIVGTMIDGKGNNLSEKPVADLVNKPMTEQVWQQLGQSTWVGDGKPTAPRVVYAFTDPNCPYCNKFWNDARPWVKSGKVQLRHVMVAILGPTSPGKAAAILAAKDPEAALTRHEQAHATGGVKPLGRIPQKTAAQLEANQKLMQQLGSSATPTIFYKDASGKVRKIQGAPSTDLLTEVLGPR
ncbi:thiol:disulfide interchange protein DsbG [Thiobacillus denitrificans ATCC 25259]|uniref:Thiol:disulfide interchange protein n=1 Tax=Thiobacillus denitrificans (strain ATCC 25259 / T1) TaxID=292415 RepID=Q3SF75_THIDA|nr:thiol:disulfide interchange protein DsbG [Thiobacillus denitrificans]AAZ98740.1 thiol:disulfide interchange protein DsbG [Thiobacillus denitrificans ATCC 25259]